MSKEREQLTHLYDDKGNFLGVFVSEELWTRTKDKIAPIFHAAIPQKQSERKEPMADWEALKNYWDFKYPINYEVKCDLCGSETQDWTQDDPRKFKLLACNIGGLVRFRCLHCNGIVTKRHFKDKIQVNCLKSDACRLEAE